MNRPGMRLAVARGAFVRQITTHRRFLCIIFAGVAFLLVLVATVLSPSGLTQLRVIAYGKTTPDDQKSQPTTSDGGTGWTMQTNLRARWDSPHTVQDGKDDSNWPGLLRMRTERAEGSLWWDERAEQYFISKLEKSQFPVDCSQAHWIAKYDLTAGLLASTHMFQLPLFFAMLRGHTLVPISEPKRQLAFEGCGPSLADRNINCFYNVTNCNPADDPSRLTQIMAMPHNLLRTTWDEVLMEEDDFFPPGGVTVTQTMKVPEWTSQVCVESSSFTSFLEAYTYHKLSVWNAMGRQGKVGVSVIDLTGRKSECPGNDEDRRARRVDMVMSSLLSSWMLNRTPNAVKLVADQIMSRYVDTSGQPLWTSPVLAVHIRQTDKSTEDPYWKEHGTYRPIEDYAMHVKKMEDEYGFRWPSVFIISDSGTAMESLMTVWNGNDPATQEGAAKRYIMYDWTSDDHLVEKFEDHTKVPKALKHDMQVHFLATLYIVQKIADHAVVTYSSNVGRFIGEIMAAKHRLAFVDREGPLVTSLDDTWKWN